MLRSSYTSRQEYNEYFRAYRNKNRAKIRKYNRLYNRKWRKKYGYETEKRSKLKFPEKEKARKILQSAVRRGILKRGKCQVCKSPKTHGHHDDYNKPLEVKWLCALHHTELHRKKLFSD